MQRSSQPNQHAADSWSSDCGSSVHEHLDSRNGAFLLIDAEGKKAFRDDLIALAADENRATDGSVVCDWEYLTAVATRA